MHYLYLTYVSPINVLESGSYMTDDISENDLRLKISGSLNVLGYFHLPIKQNMGKWSDMSL